MDHFVYYRVSVERVASAERAVRSMQGELAGRLQKLPSLKRRPEAKEGEQTWMEIYLDVPADFEQTLKDAAERHGVTAHTGPRHVELFMDLPACA